MLRKNASLVQIVIPRLSEVLDFVPIPERTLLFLRLGMNRKVQDQQGSLVIHLHQ